MESSGSTPPGGLTPADVPEIAAAFDAPGPFVTIYLATETAVQQAAQQNELRWKDLRKGLDAAGAPEGALAAIDRLVPDAHRHGATLAVVANQAGTVLVRHALVRPQREFGRLASLPIVGPMLSWEHLSIPHITVVADRTGADIVVTGPDGGEVVETVQPVETHDPVVRKSKPGGWSQRRYQTRAENVWEQNAKSVADQVTIFSDATHARLVVLAGDVRALEKLREQLPERVMAAVREADGTRAPGGNDDELADEVSRLVASVSAEDAMGLLDVFKQERGQHNLASEGAEATLAALAAAQVDTLLVHDDPDDSRTAWFSARASGGMVAADARTLRQLGIEDPEQGRLADVAIRAAFKTGAAIRMIPSVHSVDAGIGAVLRF